MTAAIPTIDPQIDTASRDSSRACNISPGKVRTLQDLVLALEFDPQISMLKTTAGRVSACLGLPLNQLAIDVLVDLGPAFTGYLKAQHYKPNAVRAYRNYTNILLRKARELGWEPSKPIVPGEWQTIFTALGGLPSFNRILRFAIRNGKNPSQFCDRDLDAWENEMVKAKLSVRSAQQVTRRFRRALIQLRLAEQVPNITSSRRGGQFRYGVPLKLLPESLRNEVQILLDWKQAPYEEDRPHRAKHRKITAKHLEAIITRLYGFITNVRPRLPGSVNSTTITGPDSLLTLVTKDSIGAFIDGASTCAVYRATASASR